MSAVPLGYSVRTIREKPGHAMFQESGPDSEVFVLPQIVGGS